MKGFIILCINLDLCTKKMLALIFLSSDYKNDRVFYTQR